MACGPQCRCCVLGLCCPPGGIAQREAFKAWLLEKLTETNSGVVPSGGEHQIDAWLDGLPWKPGAA